jgi:DNA-binding response OmpR family regulator
MLSTATSPHSLFRPAFWPLDPNKILVIDDDAELVDALRRRLTQQKFEVLVAITGEQGRTLARRHRPDLILLDVGLPDISGLDLCQELTDAPGTCGIPVILLSGCDQADVIERSRAAGGEYFIRKPYDPNALLTLVRHALRASRTWPLAAEVAD